VLIATFSVEFEAVGGRLGLLNGVADISDFVFELGDAPLAGVDSLSSGLDLFANGSESVLNGLQSM